MKLTVNSFAHCCGIQIISDFGNTAFTGGQNREFSIKDIEAELKRILVIGTEDWNGLLRPPQKLALTLIALNAEQHKKLHKCLLRHKFKLVSKGWNMNHKDYNYLYSLERKKVVRKVPPKKGRPPRLT